MSDEAHRLRPIVKNTGVIHHVDHRGLDLSWLDFWKKTSCPTERCCEAWLYDIREGDPFKIPEHECHTGIWFYGEELPL